MLENVDFVKIGVGAVGGLLIGAIGYAYRYVEKKEVFDFYKLSQSTIYGLLGGLYFAQGDADVATVLFGAGGISVGGERLLKTLFQISENYSEKNKKIKNK